MNIGLIHLKYALYQLTEEIQQTIILQFHCQQRLTKIVLLHEVYSVVGYVFPYRFNVQIEIKVDSRSVFHKEFKNGR